MIVYRLVFSLSRPTTIEAVAQNSSAISAPCYLVRYTLYCLRYEWGDPDLIRILPGPRL